MNTERTLERLARQAQDEPAPPVDVADRVLAALRSQATRAPAPAHRPLAWMAGLSAAAAAVLALVAAGAWQTCTDPLLAMLYQIPWEAL